jgi:hypothetical protein
MSYARLPATASITPTVSPVTRAICSSDQPFRRAAAIAVSNACLLKRGIKQRLRQLVDHGLVRIAASSDAADAPVERA